MFIIADIAGQFDALERLVKRAPSGEKIILLGDLIDRGHFSYEVIEWAMKTPNVITLLGNHEHMMLDYYEPGIENGIYPEDCWEYNGGSATRASYSRYGFKKPPQNHLDWIRSLPTYYTEPDKGIFVSHAPLAARCSFDKLPTHDNILDPDFDTSLIWNRTEPIERSRFQVFGHNSHWGLRFFGDWAICIDQSQKGILTGFHWPTGKVFEEPYVKETKREAELS